MWGEGCRRGSWGVWGEGCRRGMWGRGVGREVGVCGGGV